MHSSPCLCTTGLYAFNLVVHYRRTKNHNYKITFYKFYCIIHSYNQPSNSLSAISYHYYRQLQTKIVSSWYLKRRSNMPPNTKPPIDKSDAEWLQDHNYANLEAFMLANDCSQPLSVLYKLPFPASAPFHFIFLLSKNAS